MKQNANVITGWRIRDGVAVYLSENRTWVTDLHQAIRLSPHDLETELSWARSPTIELEIVDPYPITVDSDGVGGRRAREIIRAVGPTVRPDLQRASSVSLTDLRRKS